MERGLKEDFGLRVLVRVQVRVFIRVHVWVEQRWVGLYGEVVEESLGVLDLLEYRVCEIDGVIPVLEPDSKSLFHRKEIVG
jgi:hypothetical protein